jgi:hypothetical protein
MIELPEIVDTPLGPAAVGSSPDLLRDLLDEYEIELRRLGVATDELLAPGAPESEIRAGLADHGLTAPNELVTFFGWHNGLTELGNTGYPTPFFELTSWQAALAWYSDPNGQTHGLGKWEWNPRWLQVTRDKNPMAVLCGNDSASTPLVRATSYDGEYATQPDKTQHQVVSLCTPVTWWIAALRSGAFHWRSEGMGWDVDERPAGRPIPERWFS